MFDNVLDQIKTDLGKNSQLGNEHHLKGKKLRSLRFFVVLLLVVDSYPAVVFTPEAVSIRFLQCFIP